MIKINHWRERDIPFINWQCVDITDSGGLYEICDMCGYKEIRYVHAMVHLDCPETIYAGCICAGKMEQDIEGAKHREKNFRNKVNRRKNWLSRNWRHSRTGNDFLNIQGWNLVVYQNRYGLWGWEIGDRFGTSKHSSEDEAKMALFEVFDKYCRGNELFHYDGDLEWILFGWRLSKKGNEYKDVDGLNVGVRKNNTNPETWSCWVGKEYGKIKHRTLEDAKFSLLQKLIAMNRF